MRIAGLVLALAVLVPRAAAAFCGFYVAGSADKLVNDATQVVLMRAGTRTVLAMQNHYKGPPQDFALVVPVPAVLREADVKTLPAEVFDRIDRMGAPRLVEYWEQDPCVDERVANGLDASMVAIPDPQVGKEADLGVKVEAKFAVGEYQIVILSAKESTGLDTWLRQARYQIPANAEPLLRPYVEGGAKWFVAKVDPAKVKWVGEGADRRAELSPLRVHYDSDDFTLPIRLGLANSSGKQDLVVNILAPHQRYEVANYDNIRIPTNLDVRPTVKGKFAEFYAALFDRTVEQHPRAVVTEYAWDVATCDPCPGPPLDAADLLTLGADVLDGTHDQPAAHRAMDFVHTRLHARYGNEITDDLRFKLADPIAGGREQRTGDGALEEGSQPAPYNNFQGRYAIRYPWLGPIRCERPVRGRWGGPDDKRAAEPATNVAFVHRDAIQLAAAVAQDVPELGLHAGTPAGPPPRVATGAPVKRSGGCCDAGTSDSSGLLLGLGTFAWLYRRRRPEVGRAR